MPRPVHCRRVAHSAPCSYFKPAGIPLRNLEEVSLGVDELEALRLADLEGLYHEQASERMGVSRPTFGRIVEAARRKVAEALVRGKAIAIQGGHYAMSAMRRFACSACGHEWELPFGTGRPPDCPQCKSEDFTRVDDGQGGQGGQGGRCRGRGQGGGQGQARGRSGQGGVRGKGRGRGRGAGGGMPGGPAGETS